MYERETVIILDWIRLPEAIKGIVKDDHRFSNDILLEHNSEFTPFDDRTWKDTLNDKNFQEYYADQCATNNYTGTFENFIDDYGLEIDRWLKDQPFDFTDVKRIFFKISW